MSRPTITDVAKRAGVSKTTISRFLNGNFNTMRDETRERIVIAIKDLDYKPNAIARSLANQQTKTIGLMISDVGNPFYSEVMRGIEKVGLERGYRVLLCNNDYDINRGFSFIDSLIHGQVDGVLLMTSQMDENLIQEFIHHDIPTVLWESPYDTPKAVGQLSANYDIGIQQAVDHLVSLGHSRIAHISGTLGLPSPTTTSRIDAFKVAMAKHNLLEQALIETGNFKVDGGRLAMQMLLAADPRPTAIIGANDLTAIGALLAIKEKGLRVPEEISLIGLDDIALTMLVDPPLTTIALPRFEIGTMAMKILLDNIDKPLSQLAPVKYVFDTELILRKSVTYPFNQRIN